MFSYLTGFIIDLVDSTGWVFFPLFFLGAVGWYLTVSTYSHFLELKKKPGLVFKEFRQSRSEDIPIEENFEEWADYLMRGFYRNIRTISVLAGVAPLLGLLGTVTGMMNTFEVISLYGNNNPILMADGISEAMLTTQIGLLLAFPLLLVVAWMRSRLKSFRSHLVEEMNLLK